MGTIREKVIEFMEHNKHLTKLENEDWYETEDSLVKLVEEISGLKDDTYFNDLENKEETLDIKYIKCY